LNDLLLYCKMYSFLQYKYISDILTYDNQDTIGRSIQTI
jgi:hypothetical protein